MGRVSAFLNNAYVQRFIVTAWVAMLLVLSIVVASIWRTSPEQGSVRVSSDRQAEVSWSNGAWWVDGVKVNIDCPQATTCASQWNGKYWWIFKIDR